LNKKSEAKERKQ